MTDTKPSRPYPAQPRLNAAVASRVIINKHLVRSGRETIPDVVPDRSFALILDTMGIVNAATLGELWRIKSTSLTGRYPPGSARERTETNQYLGAIVCIMKEADRDARRNRQPLRSVFPSAPPAVSEGASPTDLETEGAM